MKSVFPFPLRHGVRILPCTGVIWNGNVLWLYVLVGKKKKLLPWRLEGRMGYEIWL